MLINCVRKRTTWPHAMQNNEQPINKKETLLNFMCSALNLKISTSVEGHCTDYIYLFKINRNEKIDLFALKLEHKVRMTSGAGRPGGVWPHPRLLAAQVITIIILAPIWAPILCTQWDGKQYSSCVRSQRPAVDKVSMRSKKKSNY